MRIAAFAIGALLLAGCVTSPVAELTPGTYTISVNTTFAGMSRSIMIDKATREAEDFCTKQGGQVAHVLNENEAGFFGVTAVGITIAFRCAAAEPQKS